MGWTYGQIDELLLGDFDEIAARWNLRPHDDDAGELPAPSSAPREVSEEEYQRIVARERAFAAKQGGPRNPFL